MKVRSWDSFTVKVCVVRAFEVKPNKRNGLARTSLKSHVSQPTTLSIQVKQKTLTPVRRNQIDDFALASVWQSVDL